MSMQTYHYIGYYLKCEEKADDSDLFEDESMWSPHVDEDYDVYIPNRACDGCFTLDQDSAPGLRPLPLVAVPDIVLHAEDVLKAAYKKAELDYGVVTYVV
jgi:hypothetical protein